MCLLEKLSRASVWDKIGHMAWLLSTKVIRQGQQLSSGESPRRATFQLAGPAYSLKHLPPERT